MRCAAYVLAPCPLLMQFGLAMTVADCVFLAIALFGNGAFLNTFAAGAGPLGIAFDGTVMWVANANNDTITGLRASDGVSDTVNVGMVPQFLVFDGAHMWVTISGDNVVSKR